jgi:DNA-binding CsgD family transcriptional regulator
MKKTFTDKPRRPAKNHGLPDGQPVRLTNRERTVLEMIWMGYYTPEIARKLRMSVQTAETHRANLMRKFRVRNVARLIRVALTQGWLSLP